MKRIVDKLNKIIFIAGIAALIIMILIISNSSSDTIDGVKGIVLLVCLLVIFLFVIFGAISVVLAVIEGVKKNKVAFCKKFFSNAAGIAVAYIIVYMLDYFREEEFLIEFGLGKVLLRIFVSTLAIIGGEYMITDHRKDAFVRLEHLHRKGTVDADAELDSYRKEKYGD